LLEKGKEQPQKRARVSENPAFSGRRA